jgi:hypothetical protein
VSIAATLGCDSKQRTYCYSHYGYTLDLRKKLGNPTANSRSCRHTDEIFFRTIRRCSTSPREYMATMIGKEMLFRFRQFAPQTLGKLNCFMSLARTPTRPQKTSPALSAVRPPL